MADGEGPITGGITLHATLMEALCAAQGEFVSIFKDTPGARSKYAPLDNVILSVRPALNKHGLVLIQPVRMEENLMLVDTTIVHAATGERLFCTYPVTSLGKAHMDMGAALTYARRYSLLTLLGVSPEDDEDGAKAGDTGQRGPASPPQSGERQSSYAAKNNGDGDWLQAQIANLSGLGDADELKVSERFQRLPQKWKDAAEDQIEARLEIVARESQAPTEDPMELYDRLLQDLDMCGSMSSYLGWQKGLTPEVLAKLPEEIRTTLRAEAAKKKASFKTEPTA